MKIIGIDPGSNVTGYGVISVSGKKFAYVDSGTIVVRNKNMADKFAGIFKKLTDVVNVYGPSEAAIERVFVHINASSALKLGEARGVALAALASLSLIINEYTARQVKQAVVGFGAAEKAQMQHMVKALLGLDFVPAQDAADALAIAICHANHRSSILGKLVKDGKKLPTSWRKMKF